MKTTQDQDLTNKAVFSETKLRAKGVEAYFGDPTTTRTTVHLETYQFDDKWVLAVTNDVERASFDIDRTMTNKAQAVLWEQLLIWAKNLDVCNTAEARKDIKVAIAPQKIAKEVFEWAINSIGTHIGSKLKDQSLSADHPYILVEFREHGKKAVVNGYTCHGSVITMNSFGTAKFLKENPHTVIYPSVACTGLENTVLYRNYLNDGEIQTTTAPTKHANWLTAMENQQVSITKNLWSINGVDSYAGFDQPPQGSVQPDFVDPMRLF